MTGPVVISQSTLADLGEVTRFFGIDLEWNRHLFRHAASRDATAFATVIGGLAEAIRKDVRFGTNKRIAEINRGKAERMSGQRMVRA
ncbi:MAG: hypothetical protein RBS35_05690 [Azonexus sp.]|jgi:hypothetical protein|nr:hypothetical protein [Azonexus sp.]